jgi:hypothetical protein
MRGSDDLRDRSWLDLARGEQFRHKLRGTASGTYNCDIFPTQGYRAIPLCSMHYTTAESVYAQNRLQHRYVGTTQISPTALMTIFARTRVRFLAVTMLAIHCFSLSSQMRSVTSVLSWILLRIPCRVQTVYRY